MLTQKTLAMFKHSLQLNSNAEILFKTDDDVFVNLKELCQDLNQFKLLADAQKKELYYGFFHK